MRKAVQIIVWFSVAVLGAIAYGVVALRRGEPLNAGWILTAALCTYAVGYRFYSKWIAARVLTLNDRRATPCEAHEDGHDFVKTNKWIVFGHHFAAISGPGPLVGPVLAAQFGYLPGTLWILIGVVMGGAVQDFVILFCSMRRDGKSLGQMVKEELNSAAGYTALAAILAILVILLAVLGLVVVKALAESPWGVFTVGATIPIAMFMGGYLRFWRVGKVLEVSAIGVVMLLLAVWGGKFVYQSPTWSLHFTLGAEPLAWGIIVYGLAASVLPVWLLLAPRDYLSTFMKIGTILALATGTFLVLPDLKMPTMSRFIDGSGLVVAGKLFPFCFITIACGAISGFHTLIASGTTPKLITRERYARPIGYGAMCMESFVAVMAMIAACTLEPGVYLSMNVKGDPAATVTQISALGFPVTEDQMNQLAHQTGEKTLFGRTGGAATLAVGMAHIFSQAVSDRWVDLWYHFAIMFEALFILTTLDAGTRVGRYLLQDALGLIWKPMGETRSFKANLLASVLMVGAWGFFLIQGVRDPLGGINSLWPLFGIANQLLAAIALCLATTIIIKMEKPRFAWITLLPLTWLISVTFTAAFEKIFNAAPRIGFLAMAKKLSADLASGKIAADKIAGVKAQIFNNQLDAAVAAVFLALVVAILVISAREWILLLSRRKAAVLREAEAVWLPETALAGERVGGGNGWFWGIGFLGLGLLRHLSGQTQFDRLREQPICCVHQNQKPHNLRVTRMEPRAAGGERRAVSSRDQQGRLWAEMEENRFQSPRCC
ncbi:MAG: carbon starvation protein A [Verrucomicrobia bacterium]|nr:carbon starvation protein A [Verrucomicrobiota bacterium]